MSRLNDIFGALKTAFTNVGRNVSGLMTGGGDEIGAPPPPRPEMLSGLPKPTPIPAPPEPTPTRQPEPSAMAGDTGLTDEDIAAMAPIGGTAEQPQSPAGNTFNIGRITYYTPTGDLTSTGTTPLEGRTAAKSRDWGNLIPMGSMVTLPDGNTYRIEDLTAQFYSDKEGNPDPNRPIEDTIDIFSQEPRQDEFPFGMTKNAPAEIVGQDLEGLRYNLRR